MDVLNAPALLVKCPHCGMLKAMENLVCLYGDVRGIAGGAVLEIKSLEMPDLNLLGEE